MVGRERAASKTGYALQTVGRAVLVLDKDGSSRQRAFIFETIQDVTKHPLYAGGQLSDAFDLAHKTVSDGPVLRFGPEVTVGG